MIPRSANIVFMPTYNDIETRIFTAGVLEAACKIYPTSLVVTTRNPQIKLALKQRFGGTIYPGRWIMRSKSKRIRLLRGWLGYSMYRSDEIKARLFDLENDYPKEPND